MFNIIIFLMYFLVTPCIAMEEPISLYNLNKIILLPYAIRNYPECIGDVYTKVTALIPSKNTLCLPGHYQDVILINTKNQQSYKLQTPFIEHTCPLGNFDLYHSHSYPEIYAVTSNPEDSMLFIAKNYDKQCPILEGHILTGEDAQSFGTKRSIYFNNGHTKPICDIAYLPLGILASLDCEKIILSDALTGKYIRSIKDKKKYISKDLLLSLNERLLASTHTIEQSESIENGTEYIKIYDTRTKDSVYRTSPWSLKTLALTKAFNSMSFLTCTKTNQAIQEWDLRSETIVRKFDVGPKNFVPKLTSMITYNTLIIAIGNENMLYIWDHESDNTSPIQTIQLPIQKQYSLNVCPDGTLYASGTDTLIKLNLAKNSGRLIN